MAEKVGRRFDIDKAKRIAKYSLEHFATSVVETSIIDGPAYCDSSALFTSGYCSSVFSNLIHSNALFLKAILQQGI